MIKDLEIINNSVTFKHAFGSFVILDNIDVVDHPEIYEFAKIVSNYLKMQQIENIFSV